MNIWNRCVKKLAKYSIWYVVQYSRNDKFVNQKWYWIPRGTVDFQRLERCVDGDVCRCTSEIWKTPKWRGHFLSYPITNHISLICQNEVCSIGSFCCFLWLPRDEITSRAKKNWIWYLIFSRREFLEAVDVISTIELYPEFFISFRKRVTFI